MNPDPQTIHSYSRVDAGFKKPKLDGKRRLFSSQNMDDTAIPPPEKRQRIDSGAATSMIATQTRDSGEREPCIIIFKEICGSNEVTKADFHDYMEKTFLDIALEDKDFDKNVYQHFDGLKFKDGLFHCKSNELQDKLNVYDKREAVYKNYKNFLQFLRNSCVFNVKPSLSGKETKAKLKVCLFCALFRI